MSGFTENMSNLPPGCSTNDIEERAGGEHVSYAWYCSGLPVPPKEQWATNALRFLTAEEAQAYGDDLGCRWFAMGEGEVRQTSDPANYVWKDGKAERLD